MKQENKDKSSLERKVLELTVLLCPKTLLKASCLDMKRDPLMDRIINILLFAVIMTKQNLLDRRIATVFYSMVGCMIVKK